MGDSWEDACSLLEQLSSVKSDPVLIDFGGLSYYTCGIPIKSSQIEEYADTEDFQTLERDIGAFITFDRKNAQNIFQKWRTKAQFKRLNHYQQIFNQWHRMYVFRIQKKEHEANLLRNYIREWRLYICENKATKASGKIASKRCFLTWKKQHQIFSLTTRINKASAKIKKLIFFKKWKNKLAHKRDMKKKQAVSNLFKNKMVNTCFSLWYEKYLTQTRKLRTNYHHKLQYFKRWNTNFELSQKLSTAAVAVHLEHDRLTQVRFFLVWRRKARISMKKRSRKMVNNWAKFTTEMMKFYQVRQNSAKYAQKRVFGKMKERIVAVQGVFLSQYMEKWKRFVDLQKKKKMVIASTQSFAIYRALGRWYISWRACDDMRLINTVRENVINPHLKERFFTQWVVRAQESVDTKRNMAILQRKKSLEFTVFAAWRHYVAMKSIRAEEHYNKTLMTGAFALFMHGTIGNSRENEIKAAKFREKVLKRKYFRRFRLYKHFEPTVTTKSVVENEYLSDVITALNSDLAMTKFGLY